MSLLTRLPFPLGRGVGGSSIFTNGSVAYDYAIAGLPFLSAATRQSPHSRKTAEMPEQSPEGQNSAEPGEQSINSWWLKSQSSFHLGAGQEFMDTPSPNSEAVRPLRYATSAGLDVWTPGQVKLLPQTDRVQTLVAGALLTADTDGTATRILVATGNVLQRITETVSGGVGFYSTQTVTWGGTGTILALCTDGTNYYAADSSGIYRGILTGGSPGSGTKIYTFPTGVQSLALAWAKQRLMCGLNVGGGSPASVMYELVANPPTPPVTLPSGAAGSFSQPKYTHPNPLHQWTAISEGPRAIYAAGYAGSVSTIYKFALDSTGAVPVLAQATSVTDLPAGEICYGLASYLSALLGIITTNGVRMAAFADTDSADLQLGPISIEMTGNTSGAILGGIDRFVFCGYTHEDGTAGLARLDVSQQLTVRQYSFVPDQRFGWAPDLRAADSSEHPVIGSATALARTRDGRLIFVVPNSGVYIENPKKKVPSGTLTTSQIRYTTLDPKIFRFVRVRAEGTGGTVSVGTSRLAGDAPTVAGTIELPGSEDSGDMATNMPPSVAASLQFTLTRNPDDVTDGPRFIGYQLKALSAQKRQRNIILPLSVFDFEQDATGQQVGGEGTALSRLRALEQIEEAGDVVTLQYLGATADQLLTEQVVIESIEFLQTSDPSARQGWGGVALTTLRTAS